MASNRHRNDGLLKRCGHTRVQWAKCSCPWFMAYKPRRGPSAGVHVRKSLDDLVTPAPATKTDALRELRRIKAALDAGELVAVASVDAAGRRRIDLQVGGAAAAAARGSTMTLEQLLAAYDTHYLSVKRAGASLAIARLQTVSITRTIVDRPGLAPRPFGEWAVAEITAFAVERFAAIRAVRRTVTATDAKGRTFERQEGGRVGANRSLALLRAAFNWAIRSDLVERSPFKRGTETVVKLTREDSRRRRLEGDEAERLLNACDPPRLNPKTKQPFAEQPPARLRPLVEAALETGCRLGELLSLQWWQVKRLDGRKPEIELPAAKTKTRRDRTVPISGRLKAILEMRRNDPAGEPHGPQAFVFGDEVGGRPAGSIKTAWRAACGRAGIHDLHFHDLRREAGSRWLEGGVPLQTVRDWLGHTNISQTSTYLETTLRGAHEAMQRFEERREAAASAATDVQRGATGVGNQGSQATSGDTSTNKNAPESIN